jgi:hypothetical protein
VNLPCPECGHYFWCSPKTEEQVIKCEKCGHEMRLPPFSRPPVYEESRWRILKWPFIVVVAIVALFTLESWMPVLLFALLLGLLLLDLVRFLVPWL